MENYVIIGMILCIIGVIVFYLCRAKKRGETCIGCPYARQCTRKSNGCQEKEKTDSHP